MNDKKFTELTSTINRSLAALRKDQTAALQGFSALSQSALKEGALSALSKELLALALGIAAHCEACIGFHVKALVRLGVTREQLTETLAVCVYMGGGPHLMYAAQALQAYEEFSAA